MKQSKTKYYYPLLLAYACLLSACSQQAHFTLKDVPAFSINTQTLAPKQAAKHTEQLDFRSLNKETTEYFEHYLVKNMHSRQIAIQLRNLIHSPAFVDFEYSGDKTFTAQQAFDKAQGNCIGYSHLYLALARHFGLKARYQLVETDPTLVLKNKKISLFIHVNVVVTLPNGKTFTADTVPSKQHLIKRGKIISDQQADALHYNNLAINALDDKDYETSYQYLTKALSLDANLSLLWSNIGALYRKNHQHDAAELSYQNALALDSYAYAALNNLAALFNQQGDSIRSHYYLNKIRSFRERNPYHHYNLALLEIDSKNYAKALKLVKKSTRIKEEEPEFHFQQSVIYELLNDLESSQSALTKAIGFSTDPKRTREFETRAKKLVIQLQNNTNTTLPN